VSTMDMDADNEAEVLVTDECITNETLRELVSPVGESYVEVEEEDVTTHDTRHPSPNPNSNPNQA